MFLIYLCIVLFNFQRPPFFRAKTCQLDQAYYILWAFCFNWYRYFPLSLYCFCKLIVEGTVRDWFNIWTRLAFRLAILYRSQSACAVIGLHAEACIAWFLACLKLVLLRVKVELDTSQYGIGIPQLELAFL